MRDGKILQSPGKFLLPTLNWAFLFCTLSSCCVVFVFPYRSQKPKAKKAKKDGGNEPESDVFAFSEENEEFLDAETIVDQADAEAAAAEGAKKPTKR